MDHDTGYVLFMDRTDVPEDLLAVLHRFNIKQIDTSDKSSSHFLPIETPATWVVVVDTHTPVSPELIAAYTSVNRSHAATLLVLVGNQDNWPEQLTGCCHDFVQWPCSERELKLRLLRLREPPAPPAPYTPDRTARLIQQAADLNLIGQSPAFTLSLDLIQKFAACDAPVFIDGETGTGKELAARGIHFMSQRRDKPFVAINCGALPESLIESELFGNIKGAFTDAARTRKGLVSEAQGGTLFLDEIDALSPKCQVALLRFLQDQTYRPVGAAMEQTADVRIIAATNQVAAEFPCNGKLRKDLFYRLYIMALTLPPLRQRGGDIPLLVNHFVYCYNERYAKQRTVENGFMAWLEQQDWNGNVRELENFMHRTYLMNDGDLIRRPVMPAGNGQSEMATESGSHQGTFHEAKCRMIEQFERDYLIRLLKDTQGNVSEAARRAGKERRALGKLIKKHCIQTEHFRDVKLEPSGSFLTHA